MEYSIDPEDPKLFEIINPAHFSLNQLMQRPILMLYGKTQSRRTGIAIIMD
jgi:hypothetical protein